MSASVDSKPLTQTLSPLDATLTKNGGRGQLWLTRQLFGVRRLDVAFLTFTFPADRTASVGLSFSVVSVFSAFPPRPLRLRVFFNSLLRYLVTSLLRLLCAPTLSNESDE